MPAARMAVIGSRRSTEAEFCAAAYDAAMTTGGDWLVCDGRVLCSLEVADTRAARRRGLLGRDEVVGAVWFPRTRSVHTIGMRQPIDVAVLDAEMCITRVVTLRPQRVLLPRRGERSVVETGAGEFQRWGVGPGDTLAVS
jgi:uncharacterized membrane protein (UPF0127 family)